MINEKTSFRGYSVIVCALILIIYLMSGIFSTPTRCVNIIRIVGPGDTLWGLVDSAMTETKDSRDIQEVIYNTRIANGLKGKDIGYLKAGRVVVVPCQTPINQ